MIKVGDIIPCSPNIEAKEALKRGMKPLRKARVVYIHPEGRFYTVEFDCGHDRFRDTKSFTKAELEEAYSLGIFQRPVEEIIADPRELRRQQQSQQWRNKHKPVEDPDYDDFEDDISTIMAMA